MSDHLRDHCGIFWGRSEAKLRRYSTASGSKATLVKIELEVTDRHALSHIVSSLEEALRPPPPPPAAPVADRRKLAPPQLALPAPRRLLGNGGGHDR